MRVLKPIFDFYINSSIHVALAVYAMSWITLIEFGVAYDENVLYFIFYASITGYNFVKFFGLAKFHHRSLASWLKIIQVFSFFCFLLMVFYAFRLHRETFWIVVGSAVVTFLYAIPFLPRKMLYDSKQNLRSISGLKAHVIALVWAVVTVILPLVNNQIEIDFDVIVTVLQRFMFVLVLILPFDIIDMSYDSLKLATIPQKIGIKNTKILGVLLLIAFVLMEFLKDELVEINILVLFIVAIVTALFVLFSKKERSRYYSVFWVEGLPILWLMLMLLLN